MRKAKQENKNTLIKCIRIEIIRAFLNPKEEGIENKPSFLSTCMSCKAYTTSNAATQSITAIDNTIIEISKEGLMDKYAPIGANAKPSPKTKCEIYVNRLVKLQVKTTSNAIGERKKHSLLIKYVVKIKAMLLRTTNNKTVFGEILPDGISRVFVRGFFASIFLSTYLLNPIAALRANKTANITKAKVSYWNFNPLEWKANTNPKTAKGRENIV